MQSTFALTAFVTTGLAAVAAMSCAVAMWNMINQIKTVRIRTGQNRRKQR
jgi:cobalamin biosynthesis protein CbiD